MKENTIADDKSSFTIFDIIEKRIQEITNSKNKILHNF